jgi:hypothetical protein
LRLVSRRTRLQPAHSCLHRAARLDLL